MARHNRAGALRGIGEALAATEVTAEVGGQAQKMGVVFRVSRRHPLVNGLVGQAVTSHRSAQNLAWTPQAARDVRLRRHADPGAQSELPDFPNRNILW